MCCKHAKDCHFCSAETAFAILQLENEMEMNNSAILCIALFLVTSYIVARLLVSDFDKRTMIIAIVLNDLRRTVKLSL